MKKILFWVLGIIVFCLCCMAMEGIFSLFRGSEPVPVQEPYIPFTNTGPVVGWLPWTVLILAMTISIALQYKGVFGSAATVVISFLTALYSNTQDYWFLSGAGFALITVVIIPLVSWLFGTVGFGAYKLTKGNEVAYFGIIGLGGFASMLLGQVMLILFKLFEFNLGLEFGLFEQVIAILGATTFGGFLLNLLP